MLTEFKSLSQTLCLNAKLLVGKVISRKFIVFAIATHMVYTQYLPGPDWMMIAMIYIGIEGALDWRRGVAPQEQTPTSSGPP